ncbi:uncharacterized protein G2W53_009315 [Senna tora]|uniref:Uncharacterized protein n=1 Tax=Senna tora TaxID=362788 RepID=A0A834WXS3_9FABA|nr:uncharacterized protein G2W53_009315 [Senna tora]
MVVVLALNSISERSNIKVKEDAIADLAETERRLESLRERDENNDYVDVNEEAEAFIKLEHRRIDITGFMSMRAV